MTDATTSAEERRLTPGFAASGQRVSWLLSATRSPPPCCPTCSPPPWASPPPPSGWSGASPTAGRHGPAGRRRHRQRPLPPPRPGRCRLHDHRHPLQPDRRRHHRLAGRHPPRRRLGRPGLTRPGPQRPAADIVPASVYGFERAMANPGAIVGPCSSWPWSAQSAPGPLSPCRSSPGCSPPWPSSNAIRFVDSLSIQARSSSVTANPKDVEAWWNDRQNDHLSKQ
jgi:hypothetical protein